MTTVVVGGLVVGFDGQSHRYIDNGQISYEGDTITYVGPVRDEEADVVIDASGKVVIPGLVDTHMHTGSQVIERLYADIGRRDFFQSGFLNASAVPRDRPGGYAIEEAEVGGRFAFLELLRGGVTTAVEVGGGSRDLAEVAVDVGIRAYIGLGLVTGRHVLDDGGLLSYDWDPDGELERLDEAVEFVAWLRSLDTSLVDGMLFPVQVDTCSRRLLSASAEASTEMGIGLQVHAGQNLREFHEVVRREGMTPIELLADTGVLNPRTILGHAVLTTDHPFAHFPAGKDLELIAASGASVAHCPLSFARRGNALHSFDRYLNAGITMSIGTDTYPRDMFFEMRLAGLVSKVVDASFLSAPAADIFNAATIGGATALGRSDLGRLSVGGKADLAVVDLNKLRIGPYVDPIQALVNCATSDDVEVVIVGGRTLVVDGQFCDEKSSSILSVVREWAADAVTRLPSWHLGLTVDEYAPPTYATWVGPSV